jgi:membrane protease YdiL (CAAX protease family)
MLGNSFYIEDSKFMISFKKALFYVSIIIIFFRSTSILNIFGVSSDFVKIWSSLNYIFSFIVYPIVILIKGNFKELKCLFVSEKKNKMSNIFLFSFLAYCSFFLAYSMFFYLIMSLVKIPVSYDKSTYSLSYTLFSIFMIPFFEEIFFRRIIAKKFFYKYGLKRAIFYSAFLFMISHNLSNGGLLEYFLFGVLFAFIYLKTMNIYIVIAIHMLNNFFQIYFSGTSNLLMLFDDLKLMNYFWSYYFMIFIISILIVYYSIRHINKYYAKYIS